MDNITFMSLCLVATLFVTSHCNYEENENIKMICAVGNQVFAKEYGENNTMTDLGKFDGDVTGFSKFNGYLYVSAKRSWFFKKDSAIWRVKLDNSSSSGINASTWEKFHVLNRVYRDILSLVIAKGYIYAGRSDGIMWRCSADKPNSCKDFNKLEGEIIAIDYNPVEDKICIIEDISASPQHYFIQYKFFRTCSADTANSCDKTVLTYDKQNINFMNFAFDSFWFDTGKSDIWRISYDKENGTLQLSEAIKFNDVGPFKHIYVGASNNYLYVNTQPGSSIWRCDPNTVNSCTRPFKAPIKHKMGPFIIL